MSHKYGREVDLFLLGQAAAGTAASGNFHPVSHYGFTPRRNDPLSDDQVIGQAQHNAIDPQSPTDDLVDASMDLDLPLCLNQLGFILPEVLKAATPTGTDPYTHVFTSDATSHKGLSAAWKEGSNWRRGHTFVASRFEFGFGQEGGRRRCRLSGMMSDITKPGSDPTGTPTTQLALNTIAAGKGCTIRKNSVTVARILGGSFSIERTLVAERYAGGDRTATEFLPDVAARIGGNMELRVTDDTFYDFARGKTADDFEFEFQVDANNKITFACPAVRFEPAERPVSGPGLRTESYSFRAEQTDSAPALTATLINSVASYARET